MRRSARAHAWARPASRRSPCPHCGVMFETPAARNMHILERHERLIPRSGTIGAPADTVPEGPTLPLGPGYREVGRAAGALHARAKAGERVNLMTWSKANAIPIVRSRRIAVAFGLAVADDHATWTDAAGAVWKG